MLREQNHSCVSAFTVPHYPLWNFLIINWISNSILLPLPWRPKQEQLKTNKKICFSSGCYFHGWSIIFFSNFKTKARMTWLIEVSDYSIPLQWFNHVHLDMIKFLFLVCLYQVFFFKQTNKCFTVGHRKRNSLETQKLSTEKLWLVIHLRYNH